MGLLGRRLGSALHQGLARAARAAVPRAPFPLRAAPAAQRWGSTNFPATSFLNPQVEAEADV